MSDSNVVHMFWHGGELPPLAQASVRSFTRRGHRVRVHTYRRITLPDGAVAADARDVIPEADPRFRLLAAGAIAAFADCFRYRLLARDGGWWADTDVLCLTDVLPDAPRIWAEQEPGTINNAILRFDAGDPLAASLAEEAARRARPGLAWGAVGPDLATEVLGRATDVDAAGLRTRLYPVHWREVHLLCLPSARSEVEARLSGAWFLHAWARALENLGVHPWRAAPRGSYLASVLRGIPGVRPLPPLARWRLSRVLRAKAASGGAAAVQPRHSNDARAEAAVTWLRRSVVLPFRAARRGLQLPPGTLDDVQHRIDTDRTFFLERARRHGPVFKALVDRGYTTCVIGHARGARLIAAHEGRLGGYTVDLTDLFPIGALRGMRGDTHRTYRRQFLHAVQATPLEPHAGALRAQMGEALADLAAASPAGGAALRDRLRRTGMGVMMRLIHGIPAGSAAHADLAAAYRRFGPAAPVTTIEPPQAAAFRDIAAHVARHADHARGAGANGMPACVLRHLANAGDSDATTMGNLVYLLEAAHFDLYSLWHWMLRFVAQHPRVQMAYRACADDAARDAYARAIVHETLRLEQSELLYWRVTEDIAFERYLIPRGTTLRVCIWEGHKDPAVFPEPFAFRPERFLERTYGLDAFAPFGLGARRCIGAAWTIDLSAMLLRELLEGYAVDAVQDGEPVKGKYHWQPSPQFTVRLVPRGR